MGAIVNSGAAYIAAQIAASNTVDITQFVLANIVGLDETVPVDLDETLPDAGDIVFQGAVNQTGFVNNDSIVYSLVLTSSMGDFDFNWIGLTASDGTLISVSYSPVIQKIKTVVGNTGNNLVRNFLIQFADAQSATNIVIEASTWQLDFTGIYSPIDHNHNSIYSLILHDHDDEYISPSAAQTIVDDEILILYNAITAALGTKLTSENNLTDLTDPSTARSTLSVYSSTQTDSAINNAINALVAAAPGAMDTLNEFALALNNDPNFATTITNALAGKANQIHNHAIENVIGLVSALAAKAALSHTHSNYISSMRLGAVGVYYNQNYANTVAQDVPVGNVVVGVYIQSDRRYHAQRYRPMQAYNSSTGWVTIGQL